MSDIGKTIWSRGHKERGIVVNESERYCAACGRHSCLIVRWEDGKKTKPCTHGIKCLFNGDLEIMCKWYITRRLSSNSIIRDNCV